MARGLVEMMWPCMRWWASQCHLQPLDPLQTIPLTTSSPPRDLLLSHTTIKTLPMMSLLMLSKNSPTMENNYFRATQFFQQNFLFTYKLIFYVIVVVCAMLNTVLVVMYELVCCFPLLEIHNIRASVDALCRDGAGQISRERVQRGRLTRQGTTS